MEPKEKKRRISGTTWCSAINCRNNKKVNQNIAFFRFPKDPSRCVYITKAILQNCSHNFILF